jgi:hypothetical protein
MALASTVNLGFDSHGTHGRTEIISYIIACLLVTRETTCPQSCFLATAVVLSPVYTAVTWQWVYMSQYFFPCCVCIPAWSAASTLDCTIHAKAYRWIGAPLLHRAEDFLLPGLSTVWLHGITLLNYFATQACLWYFVKVCCRTNASELQEKF